MTDSKKKYIDVDVCSFLEKIVKNNTLHYQSDFELDKAMFRDAALSERKEDKTLLWLSRSNGTQCNKEHDVFVRDSSSHATWRYFGEQGYDVSSIIACTVEITGFVDDIVRGNIYEMDFAVLSKDIQEKAVAPLEYQKTFEDGYVVNMPFLKSSYSVFSALVAEHGAIVHSLAIPQDANALSQVLSGQKSIRDKLKPGNDVKPSFDEQVKSASERVDKSFDNIQLSNIER